MCPTCGQSAPVRFDAGGARCSACGALRPGTGGAPLALAGEPQRIGGLLASWAGWAFMLGGLSFAALLGWAGVFLFGTFALLKYVSLPLAVLSFLSGGGVIFAGRKLKQRGAHSQRKARVKALQRAALARGGSITVAQAAAVLRVPETQADALLTELAISQEVQQELTDQGELFYSFSRLRVAAVEPRKRVSPSTGAHAEETPIEELEAILEPPPSHRKVAR